MKPYSSTSHSSTLPVASQLYSDACSVIEEKGWKEAKGDEKRDRPLALSQYKILSQSSAANLSEWFGPILYEHHENTRNEFWNCLNALCSIIQINECTKIKPLFFIQKCEFISSLKYKIAFSTWVVKETTQYRYIFLYSKTGQSVSLEIGINS